MGKLCCSVYCAVLGIISIICGCLVVFLIDSEVDNSSQEKLVLREDSDFFKNWAKPQFTYRRVYFFYMRNVKQYLLNMEKPDLVEVGPYTYRVKWMKTNITFRGDRIDYKTVQYYYFDRAASVGPESDKITTLNIPVLRAAHSYRDFPSFAPGLSDRMIRLNEFAFTKKTVSDLLWGYEDLLNSKSSIEIFGYFTQINGSVSKEISVHSGSDDVKKLGMIQFYNYRKYIHFWKKDSCNIIKGTDGTLFPLGINKQTELYLFKENLCRSLPLIYDKDVEQNGMKGYRFTPPADVFGSVENNKENECLCNKNLQRSCFNGKGLSDITRCYKYESPAFLSWPHFYQANPYFTNFISGMSPDKRKHQYYMDISPDTGVTYSARARIQINFRTERVVGIAALQNVDVLVMPVIWFEDGFNSNPQHLIEHEQALAQKNEPSSKPNFTPKQLIKLAMLLVFFILGGLLLLLATILILTLICSKSKTSQKSDNHTNSKEPPQYTELQLTNGVKSTESYDTSKQID